MTKANKDKHAYELLSGDRVSIGWLSEKDMRYLEDIKEKAQMGVSYFSLLQLVRGVGSYPLEANGSSRLTPEIAQSALFRVASDIVERAGIRQGVSIPPGSGLELPTEEPLMSMSEAAKEIGISRAAVHLALTKGKIRGWQVGSIWVVDRRGVLSYKKGRLPSSVSPTS